MYLIVVAKGFSSLSQYSGPRYFWLLDMIERRLKIRDSLRLLFSSRGKHICFNRRHEHRRCQETLKRRLKTKFSIVLTLKRYLSCSVIVGR